jgi:predicted CoA-binding protein
MSFRDLLDHGDPAIAVVGATDDHGKYGATIYRDLKHKGFRVFAVNPNRATVDGDPAYSSLDSLPVRPDIVNIVVPPDQTYLVLQRSRDLGLMRVWVQPGAEDRQVLQYLDEHDFEYQANACIMVQSRVRAVD